MSTLRTLTLNTPDGLHPVDVESLSQIGNSQTDITVASLSALSTIKVTANTKYATVSTDDFISHYIWFLGSGATVADGYLIVASTTSGYWRMNHPGEVSIKQFGAKGDNVANDTDAIQRAINSGVNLYVPSGVYRHTPLTITNRSSLSIKGVPGTYKSQFLLTASGFSFTLATSSNVEFRDVGLTSVPGTLGTGGINTDGNSSLRVFTSIIYGFTGPGVRMGGSVGSQMSGCIIRDNLFLSCGTDGTSPQLEGIYSQDFSYTGNQFGSVAPFTLPNRPAIGVRLTSCSNGYFADNLIWQATQGAVFQSGCDYNRITNNRFEEAQHEGLVFSSCSYNTIIGNWINGNSLATVGGYDAFTMLTCNYNNVSGNSVHDWGAPTQLHRNSYVIGSSSVNNTFTNNKSRYAGTSHFLMDVGSVANSLDKSLSMSSTANVASGATVFLGPAGASAASSNSYVAEGRQISVGLRIQLPAAPGGVQTVTATLMVNGVATALVATVTGASFAAYAVGSIEIPSEASYSVRVVYSATAVSSAPRVVLSNTSI